VLTAILAEAAELVDGFLGFRFYHLPDASRTGIALQKAAAELGFTCYDEGELPAPAINLNATGEQITQKKSLVRHQRFFEREGDLSVRHFRQPQDILPRLDRFFEQHIARWAVTPYPSLFLDPMQRRFYAALADSADSNPWLRFTEVNWNGSPIAFHFGFCFDATFMWYKPSFAIALAKHSPGEVLMRNLLLTALDENAAVFDLGLGAEAFKARFATHVPTVRTWGIYPQERSNDHANPGET
jgi:CelD/BcsL family acetyltransferase involved in cellulose biosynthesis